jgi:hypothetical protein
MLDEYVWQSKHRPDAVYHAHLLVSKTAALFPSHAPGQPLPVLALWSRWWRMMRAKDELKAYSCGVWRQRRHEQGLTEEQV